MKKIILIILSIFCFSLYSQNNCNFIENGDFEAAIFDGDYVSSPSNGASNDSIWRYHSLDLYQNNTIDLLRVAPNNVVVYISDTSNNPAAVNIGTCVFNTTALNRAPNGGNIFAACASQRDTFDGFGNNRESIALKLNRPLLIGENYRFSFHCRKNQPICRNFWVYIYGSALRPCTRPVASRFDGGVSTCGFRAVLIDSVFVNNVNWVNFGFNFTAPDSFRYFITRVQDFQYETDPDINYGFFDNFRLENSVQNRLVVTASIDTLRFCSLLTGTVTFTVRMDTQTALNANPIPLEMHLPSAFEFSNSAGFNGVWFLGRPVNIYRDTIPANTISRTNSISYTVTIRRSLHAPISGQYFNFFLTPAQHNFCSEPIPSVKIVAHEGDTNFKVKMRALTKDVCSDTVDYIPKIIGGSKPYSFIWSSGPHPTEIFSRDTALIHVKRKDNYRLHVIDSNFCLTSMVYRPLVLSGSSSKYVNVDKTLTALNEDMVIDVVPPFWIKQPLSFKNIKFKVHTGGGFSYIGIENQVEFEKCHFKTCNEVLWDGIQHGGNGTIPPGSPEGILTMKDCIIEDAFRAIHNSTTGNKATRYKIGLFRNKFYNNQYGLLFRTSSDSHSIDIVNTIPFEANIFDVTRPSGKIKSYIPYRYLDSFAQAGIYLQNVNYFSLGTHGKGRNDILRCKIGIEVVRSNVDIKNFYVTHYLSGNDGVQEGCGIHANMGLKTKYFTPPGKTVNIQARPSTKNHQWADIWMGDYGVLSHGIILNLTNTSIKHNHKNAINAQSSWSLSPMKINDNYIDEWTTENEAMLVRAYYKAEIARDTILATPYWDGKNTVTLHGENLNNNDSVIFRNNFVRTSNFPHHPIRLGFMVEGRTVGKKLNIHHNQILVQGTNEEYDGALGIINSNNVHAYQNLIVGQGATKVNSMENGSNFGAIQNPLGIYANGSTSVISCNQVIDFNTGIRYSGTNLSSTMSVNTLTSHDHGLMVDDGASINPQLHQGNQWTGSLSWGAFNGNPIPTIVRQRFTVHSSNAFAGNPFWPSENTGGNWFFDDVNANDKTQCDLPPLPASNVPIKGKLSVSNFNGIATPWEGAIITGGSLFMNYNNSLVFQNQLQLFGVMQDRSQMIVPNSPEANWLQTNQNTPIGQFNRLERAIDSVMTPNLQHLQQLDHLIDQRAQSMQAISSLDSLKGIDSLGENLAVYLSQEDYHRSQISQIDNTIELLEQPRIASIYGSLDQLIAQANEIQTTALYMDYLKQMYSLNLRYLKHGELDSLAWDTIAQIANLCPLINEKAVYMARTLMMKDTSIYYNDRNNCIGYSQKQAGTSRNKLEIKLYPNPTSSKVTLRFPAISEENYDIQIFDIMGRLVLTEKLKQSKLTHELNTHILHNNLYIVRVLSNKQELFNEKLYIIK